MKNLKNFGITFAVSFVILGIIALIACGFVADTVCGIFDGSAGNKDNMNPADTTKNAEDDEERLNRQIDGQSFCWLWVVSDYRPDVFDDYLPSADDAREMSGFGTLGKNYRLPSATNIVLVRAWLDSRQYYLVNIPAMTKLETPSGEYTLGDYYAVSGIGGLKNCVEAMTGLTVDHYCVIHSTDLYDLANTVGSVECTIPKDIFTDGKNFVSAPAPVTTAIAKVTTAKGSKDTTSKSKAAVTTAAPKVTLTNELDRAESVKLATKLMAALLYYDPTDGLDDEMIIEQSFAKGLMTNLSEMSHSSLCSALDTLRNVFVSTDLDEEAIYLNGEVIRAFSWFEIHSVTYPGKLVSGRSNGNAYFKPDLQQGTKFFYNFR